MTPGGSCIGNDLVEAVGPIEPLHEHRCRRLACRLRAAAPCSRARQAVASIPAAAAIAPRPAWRDQPVAARGASAGVAELGLEWRRLGVADGNELSGPVSHSGCRSCSRSARSCRRCARPPRLAATGATHIRSRVWRWWSRHGRRRPRVVHVEAVIEYVVVARSRRRGARRVAADDDPVGPAEDHRDRRDVVVVDRPADHPRDQVLRSERKENEEYLSSAGAGCSSSTSTRPGRCTSRIPSSSARGCRCRARPGREGPAPHCWSTICAVGAAAVVVGVLLVILGRQVLVNRHGGVLPFDVMIRRPREVWP